MRILPVVAACLLVASCGSTGIEPVRPSPPPSLTQPCMVPGVLPERGLSDQEVEVFWGRDRAALRACAGRHAGLVEWAL